MKICRYLAAIGLLLMAGCGSDEETQSGATPSNGAVMDDATFATEVKANRKERTKILLTREKLIARMEAMAEELSKRMPEADLETLRKELEKDPEWNSLCRKVEDFNTLFEENRVKVKGLYDANEAYKAQQISK